jgi:tetratricopeptide (TPR) repeat protein
LEALRTKLKDAYRNDHAATCVMLAQQWLQAHPDDLPVIHNYAEMLYKLTRYEEAIRIYHEAIERFANDRYHLFLQLGQLYRYRGDFAEAEAWYQKAIYEDIEEATGYIFLGCVQARQGKLEQAEQNHRRATQCFKGCIDEAYHNLGLVLRGQGRFSEATVCFQAAIAIDNEYEAAIEALEDITAALELENIEAAAASDLPESTA